MPKKFKFFKRKQPDIDLSAEIEEREKRTFAALYAAAGSTFSKNHSLEISTVYRCIELISDGVAQLPISIYKSNNKGSKKEIYNHPLGMLLSERPNERMTRYTFIKCLVTSMLIDGDGYAYIERDEKDNVIGLHYLPPELVTPVIPMYLNQPVTYKVVGLQNDVKEADIIHLMKFTSDGIHGESILDKAKKTLGLAWAELDLSNRFFNSNASAFGVLKYGGMLKKEQKESLKKEWNEAKSNDGVILLDDSFDYKNVSLNPVEAQIIESRRQTAIEICRFFGCSPIKVFANDGTSFSYNSVESINMQFLSETLQPILTLIELEFERKLFPSKDITVNFDTKQFLRSDNKATADYLKTLTSWGLCTINEARSQLNLPPVEGGDETMVPVNIMTLQNSLKVVPTNKNVTTEDINVTEKESDKE